MANKATVPVEASSPPAATICQRFELGDEAKALLKKELKPLAFFQLLLEHKLYEDAIRFLSYLLPTRQAVWWGCMCVWHVARPEASSTAGAALEAVFRWVHDPSEDNRRAAEAAAQAAGPGTPAGALAMAVFLSGGSISLAKLPEVLPKPFLAAKTVANAVLAAARKVKPAQVPEMQRNLLNIGHDVAQGKNLWDTSHGQHG